MNMDRRMMMLTCGAVAALMMSCSLHAADGGQGAAEGKSDDGESQRRPAAMRKIPEVSRSGITLPVPDSYENHLPSLPQRWVSSGLKDYGETDSLAICPGGADGGLKVFATAKDGDQIHVFNAADGKFVRSIGKKGKDLGELNYPNGIVAVHGWPGSSVGWMLFVVERNNHRVQVFDAKTYEPVGTFGKKDLNRPYGIVELMPAKLLEVTSTPSGMCGDPGLFQVVVSDTEIEPQEIFESFPISSLSRGKVSTGTDEKCRFSFGNAKDAAGVVKEAESMAYVADKGHILACDEVEDNVKVYAANGQYTGITLMKDKLIGDPEGIVWLKLSKTRSYVILTEQRKHLTLWHVLDGRSYEHLTVFTGKPRIANTDGIALAGQMDGFPRGALVAVHDDGELRAYSLADVLKLLPQ